MQLFNLRKGVQGVLTYLRKVWLIVDELAIAGMIFEIGTINAAIFNNVGQMTTSNLSTASDQNTAYKEEKKSRPKLRYWRRIFDGRRECIVWKGNKERLSEGSVYDLWRFGERFIQVPLQSSSDGGCITTSESDIVCSSSTTTISSVHLCRPYELIFRKIIGAVGGIVGLGRQFRLYLPFHSPSIGFHPYGSKFR